MASVPKTMKGMRRTQQAPVQQAPPQVLVQVPAQQAPPQRTQRPQYRGGRQRQHRVFEGADQDWYQNRASYDAPAAVPFDQETMRDFYGINNYDTFPKLQRSVQRKKGVFQLDGNNQPILSERTPKMDPLQLALITLAGNRKTIRNSPQLTTEEGCQYFVEENPNYQYRAWDVTGPGGKKDGRPEHMIFDSAGRLKYINGLSLKKHNFPLQELYYTDFYDYQTGKPTEHDEDGNPILYSDLRKMIGQINLDDIDDDTGLPKWLYPLTSQLGAPYQAKLKIKPQAIIKAGGFGDIYEANKDKYIPYCRDAMDLAQIFVKGIALVNYRCMAAYCQSINEANGTFENFRDYPKYRQQFMKMYREKYLRFLVQLVKDSIDDANDTISEVFAGWCCNAIEEAAKIVTGAQSVPHCLVPGRGGSNPTQPVFQSGPLPEALIPRTQRPGNNGGLAAAVNRTRTTAPKYFGQRSQLGTPASSQLSSPESLPPPLEPV